jgi:hypothetical protein
MRFFFQFTTGNHRIRHEVAAALAKIYPGSTFDASISSNGPEVEEFLKSQQDIRYGCMTDYRDILHDALKQDIDYDLLRWFESTTPEKSLWRFFAVDREWCHEFLQGRVYMHRSYVHTINTHDNILKVACGYIRYFKKIMTELKPDVFVAAAGQDNMGCPISDHMCKLYGVLFVSPETIRTQNYMAFTDNRQCTFEYINETCRKLIDGNLTMDMAPGHKIYDDIHKDLTNTQYFDSPKVGHFKAQLPVVNFLYRSAKSVARQTINWVKNAPRRRDPHTFVKPVDSWSNYFYTLYMAVLQHYRRMQLLDPKFYKPFDPKSPYIYFPLHNTNEYSTQVQGTMWIDQLVIIEALAKSIPVGWKLIIKEHPSILFHRIRPMDFYKRVKSYPNVELIPTDTNTHEVVTRCQMVVTIVGTTGWEAIMRGKPVINLEENMFDAIGLSRRCTDLKGLSLAIQEELQRMVKITPEERKRRIVCLLTAIHHHAFWVENPLQVIGDADCDTAAERRAVGQVIAEAMKPYLEFRGITSGKTVKRDTVAAGSQHG